MENLSSVIYTYIEMNIHFRYNSYKKETLFLFFIVEYVIITKHRIQEKWNVIFFVLDMNENNVTKVSSGFEYSLLIFVFKAVLGL